MKNYKLSAKGRVCDAVYSRSSHALHHVDVIALLSTVDARHVLEYRGGVLDDESHHQYDGKHVEEPCAHHPLQRVVTVLRGEVGEHLTRHEEREPDEQLQNEARELGALEVLHALVACGDTRHQLDDHHEDHSECEYRPDAEHRADDTPNGRQRDALPYADVFRRRKYARHKGGDAVVTVRH